MNFSLPPYWEHFNFDFDSIEKNVENVPGSYQGIKEKALYTSREDFLAIFSHPLIQGTLVDLGCGTGESCLLYGSLYPDRQSIGVEFQAARLIPGKKFQTDHKLYNVSLLAQDLLNDPIPQGETYFLYFPTGMVLDRVLSELYKRQHPFRMVVIESHGDLLPRLQKENWLVPMAEIPLRSSRHYRNAVVFESQKIKRAESLLPHTLSYQEKFLVIRDQEEWIGESLGLEWSEGDRYELRTPPRTILWESVQEVLSFDQIDVKIRPALELRRLGELQIETGNAVFQGFIRKILLKPTFRLEISSGEQVEWSEIKTIRQGPQLCYASSSD